MKKGFFFSLDGFFALILFGLFLSMMYSFYLSSPRMEQPFYFSEDVLDVFSNVKLSELELAKYPEITGLITAGKINNREKTVFEVLVELNSQGTPESKKSAETVIRELTFGVVPEQYGFGVDFSGVNVYKSQEKEIINAIARQRLVLG
ncbi:MAG TPA: hypothetical protein VJH95_04485 [Candidatus Nanoarchaeia archaeon]|nr:hypothetical protein [Candidatus Nanoarchaeia archaeon]